MCNHKYSNALSLFRQFNYYLKVIKRVAFECPIIHISDAFYILFSKYVVSIPFLIKVYKNESLSKVTNSEDQISTYFGLEELPKVMNVPIAIKGPD